MKIFYLQHQHQNAMEVGSHPTKLESTLLVSQHLFQNSSVNIENLQLKFIDS